MPADAIATVVKEHQSEIARLEVKLRAPRPMQPNIDRLREALTQHAEQWKADLRAEPKIARLLLRRLVEPLVLHDASTRPKSIPFEIAAKPALLDGLATSHLHVASLMPASWNQVASWLKQIDSLHQAA